MSVQGIIGLSISIILITLLLLIGVYVIWAFACMRVLKYLSYPNAWMAWIPFAREWALGDAAAMGGGTVDMFGKQVPAILVQLKWLVFVINVVPVIGQLAFLAGTIILSGTLYANLYAACEGRDVSEVRGIGYLSGWLQIIALIKFFTYR